MLKIKFKQYEIFKKQINSSFNSLTKYFYNNDAGRVQTILKSNKITEKKPNVNINHITNKSSDQKIRILNDRRAKNFLKEDEESFRKKQEYLKKDNSEKSENEENSEFNEEDSFLNYDQASNKNF